MLLCTFLFLVFTGSVSPGSSVSPPSEHSSLPRILFVSRSLPDDRTAIPGFGPRDRTLTVGGQLMIRETDGDIRTLVDTRLLYDVADPCVSWDAGRVLFSGVVHPDSSWRIYEIRSDGTGFRQVTFSTRRVDLAQFGAAAPLLQQYDDFDPCYLPDGRIVCASTRYPSISGYGGVVTSNLFLVQEQDSTLRRITTERNGGEEPTIDPVTGRIVYARWWLNRDRPSHRARHGITRDNTLALTDDEANIWQAISIRSDGEGMKLYAGFPRTREGLQTYKPAVMEDGTLLSVYTSSLSILNGPGGAGIRWFAPGADFEHYVTGVRSDQPSQGYSTAIDPAELADGWILFARSVDQSDFGIAICRLDGTGLVDVVDFPGTNEMEPQVLQPRPVPPILTEEFPYPTATLPPTEDPKTYFKNDMFRFDCMNIFTNAPVDNPMPDAPRIAVGAKIRFFMNVQRQSAVTPDPSIFLKEAPVFLTGGVHEHDIPADVPLFEQVVDSNGFVLERTDGGFAHVTGMNFDRMGSGTKCVGCHPGHSVMEVPINGTEAEWFNLAPSASVSSSSDGILPDGSPSVVRRLNDRRVLTGGAGSVWISDEGEGASAGLKWTIPVEVREMVLYEIPRDGELECTLEVQECDIFLYYRDEMVFSTRMIRAGDSPFRIQVPPTDADSAAIVVKKFSGDLLGRRVAGLAEVEVIARISSLNYQHYKGE